jgi:hypothetical protein
VIGEDGRPIRVEHIMQLRDIADANNNAGDDDDDDSDDDT